MLQSKMVCKRFLWRVRTRRSRQDNPSLPTGYSHNGASTNSFHVRPIRRRTDVDVRINSRLLPIPGRNLFSECFRLIGGDQIDRATAEAPAGHSSAIAARQSFRSFNHEIKFAATDFVQIAKTAM